MPVTSLSQCSYKRLLGTSQSVLLTYNLFLLKENIRVVPQVSSLPVSRGLQNLAPAPPPSVPPPPDTPVSVVQRAERSVKKKM